MYTFIPLRTSHIVHQGQSVVFKELSISGAGFPQKTLDFHTIRKIPSNAHRGHVALSLADMEKKARSVASNIGELTLYYSMPSFMLP